VGPKGHRRQGAKRLARIPGHETMGFCVFGSGRSRGRIGLRGSRSVLILRAH
jgi:hypothetical protein